MDIIEKAKNYAIMYHGPDQRYGAQPFIHHLEQVAHIVNGYGDDAITLAWLHDIVEDTKISVDDLVRPFGNNMARWVAIVTDPSDVVGRSAKKAMSNKKFSMVEPVDHVALIVKAGDRLANMSSCYHDQMLNLFERYKREYPAFKEAAYRPGLCNDIWEAMDDYATKLVDLGPADC